MIFYPQQTTCSKVRLKQIYETKCTLHAYSAYLLLW